MENVIITTENTCDLPSVELEKMGVEVIDLEYRNQTTGEENPNLSLKEFYEQLRKGNVFKTNARNALDFELFFAPLIEKGDIIHIGLSSELSSNFYNVKEAAEKLNKTSKHHIYVIDSLNGSLGQAFLIDSVCKKREEGCSAKEIAVFAEQYKMQYMTIFSPDDFKTAVKSGRFSKVSAFIASVLNIKTVLYVNDVGGFSCIKKAVGRKNALKGMLELFKQKYDNQNKTIYIMHSDKLEDALYLKSELEKEFKDIEIRLGEIGVVIGSHCGVGTVAMSFSSKSRK